MTFTFKTSQELQKLLGERLKALRIDRRMTQAELAAKAQCSLRAVQKLEAGSGSTIDTLMRFLKATASENVIDLIAPEPMISPMAMLALGRRPARVRHASVKGSNAD